MVEHTAANFIDSGHFDYGRREGGVGELEIGVVFLVGLK